jgi:predicted esterase YcpF (UPF0227 family)
VKTLIYLHGFRSSSQSIKARQLGETLRAVRADWEYITPNLSPEPDAAFAAIDAILQRRPAHDVTLIGSSLGGFYAWVAAGQTGARAVLLNPSLAPHETLSAHVGPQTNLYTGEPFDWTAQHVEQLRAHAARQAAAPCPAARILLVVELGDELLDHTRTQSMLPGAATIVVPGGNHGLSSFPVHVPSILAHAGIATNPLA